MRWLKNYPMVHLENVARHNLQKTFLEVMAHGIGSAYSENGLRSGFQWNGRYIDSSMRIKSLNFKREKKGVTSKRCHIAYFRFEKVKLFFFQCTSFRRGVVNFTTQISRVWFFCKKDCFSFVSALIRFSLNWDSNSCELLKINRNFVAHCDLDFDLINLKLKPVEEF